MNYLIIIGVVLVSYIRAILYGGYIIDDEEVAKNKNIPKNKWQKLWWQIVGIKYYEPKIEHLIVTIIHLINCLLIYYVFGHNEVSFIASLIFAVHGAGTQGSVWLSGKGYSISTMIILLSFKFCPLLYLLTPQFAFNAVFYPLIYLRSQWWWIALLPVCVLIARGERQVIKERLGHTVSVGGRFHAKKIIVVFKTLGYYLCTSLIPTRLGIYHTFLYNYTLSKEDNAECEKIDIFFYIGLVFSLILGYAYIFHYNNAVFGWSWFFIIILPFCNFFSLNQAIGERYLYLPLIGLCLAISEMAQWIPNPVIRYSILSGYFIYQWSRLQFHIPMYYNIFNCIDYGKLNFPDTHTYYTWLGQLEKRKKGYFTALEAWFKGWKMRPKDFRLNNNIAVLLTDMGFIDQAEEFLNYAEQNIIPEQRKYAEPFIANERARIAKARQLKKQNKILSGIITPNKNA